MELILIILMIVAGGAIAVTIMIIIAIAQRNAEAQPAPTAAPDRNRVAASILLGSGAPEGSIATSALTLAGAFSAALNPKLPPWLCTRTMHGQILWT